MHQNDMRMHRPKFYAPVHTEIIRACADQNYMCTRRLITDQIVCALGNQNYMRMCRRKFFADALTKFHAHAQTEILSARREQHYMCTRISFQDAYLTWSVHFNLRLSLTETQTTKIKLMLNYVIAAEIAFWRRQCILNLLKIFSQLATKQFSGNTNLISYKTKWKRSQFDVLLSV